VVTGTYACICPQGWIGNGYSGGCVEFPATVAPRMWFDAADANDGESESVPGSVLSTWSDKSGNSYDATKVRSPTIGTTQLNGLPVVTFYNTYMNVGGSTLVRTMIAVFRSKPGNAVWNQYGAIMNRRTLRTCNYICQATKTGFHSNKYPAHVWKKRTGAHSFGRYYGRYGTNYRLDGTNY
jgi:hypothetical protein